MLEKHEVSECRIEKEGEKILLKREKPGTDVPVYQPAYQPQYYSSPAYPGPTVSSAIVLSPASALESIGAAGENKKTVELSRQLLEVKSPMVGTFYRKPAVDAKSFVEIGDFVKKGDVLCIIEAMKLMNEIESEVSGVVAEICLEDGKMVEYGEVIFRIEPK